jgi:hypothetical protein
MSDEPEPARMETALRDLGRSIDTGPVPDVLPGVLPRLAAPPALVRRRIWVGSGVAAAVACLLIGLVPGVAGAVADFFTGLPGVVFSRDGGSSHAPPPAGPTGDPSAGSLGESLGLNGQVTLDEARRAVDFPVVLPAGVGAPAEVYVHGTWGVTMVWPARPDLPSLGPSGVGLIVDVVDPRQGPLLRKVLGEAPERFLMDGKQAVWVAGPHPLVILEDGNTLDVTRLATRTLLLSEERYTARIESLLSREEAVELARSLR